MTNVDPLTTLSSRLRDGESLFLAWCNLGHPATAEALARAGFDAALVDMQHGAFDITTVAAGIAAVVAAGKPCLVRTPVGDFATASRVLDAGAAGVVAPMINSVADAEQLVSFLKYPPLGTRSWGPGRALGLTGLDGPTFLRQANGVQLAIAMIETREALAALDDILAVPGIDGILVGPSDLSIALSDGEFVDPTSAAVQRELPRLVEAARARGKFAAAFCADAARARELSAMGFQLCAIGTDEALLRSAAAAALTHARQGAS